MTLYLIGLGLWDKKDVSVRGLEIIKSCDKIFLETYTSKLGHSIEELAEFYGKEVIAANRELVEKTAEVILEPAKKGNSALLVIGDPMSATTHLDIVRRAEEQNIKVVVLHNASVMTAVSDTGLELYKFGKTTSVPFPEKSFRPKTPFDVFLQNQEMGLHTLFLLDLRPDEDRFMSVNQALAYLLEIATSRKSTALEKGTHCIGCARLGAPNQLIKFGTVEQLINTDFGGPLHCVIIPGKLHFMEEEALKRFL